MAEAVVEKKTGVVQAVKDYVADVKDKPFMHASTFALGAITMRAVDTRVIRSSLGDSVANSVRGKLVLGGVPLING